MKTPYIISIILSALMIGGYFLYKKKKTTVSDIFNDSEIQRIKTLKLENVLNWALNVINTKDVEKSSIEINILPNKATIETFKGALKLDDQDLAHCYLILVLQSNNVVARKLVISKEISSEFSCLYSNKIFAIPVE